MPRKIHDGSSLKHRAETGTPFDPPTKMAPIAPRSSSSFSSGSWTLKLLTILSIPIILVSIISNANNTYISKSIILSLFKSFRHGVICLEYTDKARSYADIHAYGQIPDTMEQGGVIKTDHICDSKMLIFEATENDLWHELLRGSTGWGKAYITGLWDIDDLKKNRYGHHWDLGDTLTLILWNGLLQNEVSLTNPIHLVQVVWQWTSYYEWRQWWIRSKVSRTEDAERENVAHSYFSTEFFELMLDAPTQSYTSAEWSLDTDPSNLGDAQINKIKIMLEKVKAGPGQRILDIGSGWGYFVNAANELTGANASGISNSPVMVAEADRRWKRPGVSFHLADYRRAHEIFEPESFDSIISVGLIAHFGHDTLWDLFDSMWKVLKPGGFMLIQGIVNMEVLPTPGRVWGKANSTNNCQHTHFINEYLWPTACILIADWVADSAQRVGFLSMHREYSGHHYGKTLRMWRDKLYSNKKKVIADYDRDTFFVHEFYLAISEAGYRVGVLEKVAFLFWKPDIVGEGESIHQHPFNEWTDDVKLPWKEGKE